MCGINGIYGLNDPIAAKQKIAAMNTSMKHRGPDDEGIFLSDKIALGHRRLSIIDLSPAGHQPMQSLLERYTIVYNGELYNYKELKFELTRVVANSNEQAYFFQTNTDTEVILAAYSRWGADCLKHFNGMFAFAIWDNSQKELFIARDRLGIKPLYYAYVNGILAFSSELRSLLKSELVPRSVDANSLVDYLRYQTVHAPNTIVKGIKMLIPGHFIHLKNDKLTLHEYWNIVKNVSHDSRGKDYPEICKDVNSLLTKAVERRLQADVPFGAFLSGGIDSSAIVGIMQKVSSERIKTFCVSFAEEKFSEANYANIIAKKFNTEHHEIRLNPFDFLEQLPEALNALDHPSGDGINSFIVSNATKNAGITMALSGLGGDELFGGYEVFQRALKLNKHEWINTVPRFARSLGGTVLCKVRPQISSEKIATFLKNDTLSFNSFYTLSRQILLDKQIANILNYPLTTNAVSEILKQNKLPITDKVISSVSSAEISTYMQNVLLRDTDQMSMAHALEVRVPFLDYVLVEYVLSLPDKYKSVKTPKNLLIDALGDMLPAEIVNRSKMGFVLPWEYWMKNELKTYCEEKIKNLSKRQWFREEEIIKMWKEFIKGNAKTNWSRVWILIVLENWLKNNGIED